MKIPILGRLVELRNLSRAELEDHLRVLESDLADDEFRLRMVWCEIFSRDRLTQEENRDDSRDD